MKDQLAAEFRLLLLLSALLVTLTILVAKAPAQTRRQPNRPGTAQTPKAPTLAANESADISITATVTARELTFEVVPAPTVEFPGRGKPDTVWNAERVNIPRPVQPGVTYRNIGVTLVITSLFADIDRIVSEALGETPSTEDTPPKKVEPPRAPEAPSRISPRPRPGKGNR